MQLRPRPLGRPALSVTATFLGAVLLLVASVQPAEAMRICTYNLLNYDNLASTRNPAFQTVIQNLGDIDVLAVQEIQDQTAVNTFLSQVLNVIEPGQWSAATFFNDPSQSFNQGLFYRTTAVDIVAADTLGNDPRDIAWYTVRPAGYSSSEAEVTIFITHFKAGSTTSDQDTRLEEAERLRLFMNTQFPAGSNMIVCGDFNMRSSTETAYQEMIEFQANNIGRVFDPINSPGSWNNNFNFRFIHTQSTRSGTLDPNDGGATGGMDDRFDFILTTDPLLDGEGLDGLTSTYEAYGQDGNHFNLSIADAPTIPEGQTVADALERASDHLPVFMDFQVPALVAADASLAFGTVIVGALAEETLTVSNAASAPADELDYTLVAPVGFTAPGGSFQDAAGGGGNLHTIGMLTGSSGVKGGSLVIGSDDPEDPARNVALSGTVLDHAAPSLDGATPVDSILVDFGTAAEGNFSDQAVDVHNLGYDALQALLDVYDAQIAGGGGRFSIVGGFSAADVGGTSETYTIAFDDAGATGPVDSTFAATLVFSTRDQQGIPGATDLADLKVALTATVTASQTGIGDPGSPVATRLLGNRPNPFAASTRIAFDLAAAGEVRLSVYDVQGRRVAMLLDRGMDAGSYTFSWSGENEDGREASPGVYFYVLETPDHRAVRRMIKLR